MTDREKQIEEIKDAIDSVYGCDCAYFGVEGLAIAEAIYNAGYRKQVESEWAELTFIIFDSEKIALNATPLGIQEPITARNAARR